MKNKKVTYLLGLVVAIVWGLIIYRVFSAANGDDVPVITKAAVKEPYDDYTIPKDTTRLLLNYRDPFGLVKPKDTVKLSAIKHTEKKIMLKPMDWSFIQYSGYMRNPNSRKLVAILSINGNSVMMAEGETSNNVKLIKNMRDSVKVSFNGKTKFIVMHTGTI